LAQLPLYNLAFSHAAAEAGPAEKQLRALWSRRGVQELALARPARRAVPVYQESPLL